MDHWWNEVREAARNTATLTAANKMVLAYQFARAREENPDGFTMNLYGEVIHLDSGYAVGVTRESFENVADALDTLSRLQDEYEFQNLHIGYWQDGARDYIDVVMVTSSLDLAWSVGTKMSQKAVWDFANSNEVWLDRTEGELIDA